jgi:predicted aldo/keto reductase-like oxidoreductase
MDDEVQAGVRGVRYAAQRGLGVVAMEPLRGGNLAKPMAAAPPIPGQGAPPQRSLVAWALRWVWNFPEISLALTSMSADSHLEENLRLAAQARAHSLTEAELETIQGMKQHRREKAKSSCTACNYCLPCPQGVAIPKILSFYDDRFVYDDRKSASIGYNFLLTPGEQAPNCKECGECEEACPQHLPIRELLKASHKELSAS